MAEGLHHKLSPPIVVENKPGANGIIDEREAVKSEPDGYTLLLAPSATLINAAMEANFPFEVMRDVVPITKVAEYPTAMVVNKKMRVTA